MHKRKQLQVYADYVNLLSKKIFTQRKTHNVPPWSSDTHQLTITFNDLPFNPQNKTKNELCVKLKFVIDEHIVLYFCDGQKHSLLNYIYSDNT
jgi:hypothetical protein